MPICWEQPEGARIALLRNKAIAMVASGPYRGHHWCLEAIQPGGGGRVAYRREGVDPTLSQRTSLNFFCNPGRRRVDARGPRGAATSAPLVGASGRRTTWRRRIRAMERGAADWQARICGEADTRLKRVKKSIQKRDKGRPQTITRGGTGVFFTTNVLCLSRVEQCGCK